MIALSLDVMRTFLHRSLASFNANKLNGLMAEVDFRATVAAQGFADRVSPGGWILRNTRDSFSGSKSLVVFPQTVRPGVEYADPGLLGDPDQRLHAVAGHFHSAGILAYACAGVIAQPNDAESVVWYARQLGLPSLSAWQPLEDVLTGFLKTRSRKFNPLRYRTNADVIPSGAVPEEFSKESLRVFVQRRFFCEISDVDGVFYGMQHAYPLEIKEKTAAFEDDVGGYFGLDVHPYTKLAFYAAKGGRLHSLFVVREISDTTTRVLKEWWVCPFERLASVASWTPRGGGRGMGGGSSTVIRIPAAAFSPLDSHSLARL